MENRTNNKTPKNFLLNTVFITDYGEESILQL